MDKRRDTGSSHRRRQHEPSSGPTSAPNDRLSFTSRLPRWWGTAALALMTGLFVTLAITSLRQESVTADEFGHLPVGYNLLTTGDFKYSELNPPLMNILSALPLMVVDMTRAHAAEPLHPRDKYSFWLNGYPFMAQHKDNYQRIFTVARLVTVIVVALLGLLLFTWGRMLVPSRPNLTGLLAAGLVWFSPGIMAHTRLVTTDAGIAFFTALALFCFHLFLRQPQAARVLVAGVALGLAQLVKFSAIYLYPIVIILAIIWKRQSSHSCPRRLAIGVVAIIAISLVTINAGYLCQQPLSALGTLELVSGPMQSVQSILPDATPVPVPESYLLAFDRQLHDAKLGDPSFLFGRAYEGGIWYYFVALMAIKTPIPLLLLALLALLVAVYRRSFRTFDTALLLLPAATFLVMFSLFSNKQLGLRMILPAAPLFWLWTSITLARTDPRRWLTAVMAILLLWFAGESLRIYPHYLTYFNQFVGGPSQGYRYASDSNLDWGQGLVGLKRYMDDNNLDTIQLYYFGRVLPEVYGINYTVPKLPHQTIEKGLLAVSSTLRGRPYILNDHGTPFEMPRLDMNPRLFGKPVATIGNSIQIYRIHRPLGGQRQVPGKTGAE